MRHKKLKVLAAILAASLSLMGCGSIMLNANLAKAKVKDYVPRDENGNAYYTPGSETEVPETLGTTLMLRADREKYQIGGTDAFYLLPSGVPVPEGLISFKVLDLLDEKTTVYAYQSIYQNDDPTGLGGMPVNGTAKDYEEVLSADNMKQMVTIFMMYNTETREYRVLFHQVDDVEVKIRPYEENTEMSMRDQLVITKNGRDIKEVGSCFSQKLANGHYTIYYDGVSRVYNREGALEAEFNIDESLKLHHILNQVETTDSTKKDITYEDFTISNVVMDSNYFVYVLLTVENADEEVSKDTDENDLEDQDSGKSAVNQQLVTFFSLDLSTWTSDDGDDESGSVKSDRYFASENVLFNQKKSLWEYSVIPFATEIADDGIPVYDAGTFDQSALPTYQEMIDLVRKKYKIRTAEELGLNKGEYAPFEFRSGAEGMDIQLYVSKNGFDMYKFLKLYKNVKTDAAMSQLLSYFTDLCDSLKCVTPDMVNSGGGTFSTRVIGKLPDQTVGGKTYDGKLVVLPENVKYQPLTEVREDVKRNYRIRYRLRWEETREREDGTKETQDVYQTLEIPVEETYAMRKEYRMKLINADSQWYDDRVTSDMIAPSAGSGVVRYNTSRKSNYQNGAWAVWQLAYSMSGIDPTDEDLIAGKAKNCMLFMDQDDPVLVLLTDRNTTFISDFALRQDSKEWEYKPDQKGQTVISVPNDKLYFGLTAEEDLVATIDSIRNNPDYDFGDSEDVNYSSSDLLGVMMDTGICFSDPYVYIASADSGIVKLHRKWLFSGQVSPYPYFEIWLNDAETIADSIGFQSSEYEYNNEDISRAKLYKVPLFDEEASVNLVLSSIQKDSDLSREILSGNDGMWNALISVLGLDRKEADLGHINRYYEFLKSGKTAQDNAVLEFYELAGIKDADRTEKLRNRILECLYKTDLEELIWEFRPDILAEEGREPVTVPAVETTKASKETDSVSEASKESSKSTQETVDRRNSSLDDQAVQEAEEKQEVYRNHQEQVNLVTSYLQEKSGMTQEAWDAKLTSVIDALHPSSSLAEYEKKMALKDFADLAGYQVQAGLDTRIKACTSVKELKELMAWYYLPSTTRAILQDDADEKAAAAKKESAEETESGTDSGYNFGNQWNVEISVPGSKSDSGTGADEETKRPMSKEELKEYEEEQKATNEKKLKQARQDLDEAFETYCKPSIIRNAEIVTGVGTMKQADQDGFGPNWNARWETWLAEKLLNIQKILKTE